MRSTQVQELTAKESESMKLALSTCQNKGAQKEALPFYGHISSTTAYFFCFSKIQQARVFVTGDKESQQTILPVSQVESAFCSFLKVVLEHGSGNFRFHCRVFLQ